MSLNIQVTRTQHPKEKPDPNHLGFGDFFTDHMFVMNYTEGQGWHDPRIIPYAPISLEPAAMVFHYAQDMFEGMKAYKAPDGRILLFRPDKNIARANNSNDRLCIPRIPEEDMLQAIKAVVAEDKDWIPEGKATSLYIRPFIIATDAHLGVRPSRTYQFYVILSPVGAYYKEGLNPVKIYVEDEYVRAVKGGMGHVKTGGNYAASIKAQMIAAERGYTQVLWLDGVHRRYVEEVGTMNVFFVIGDEVVTPALNGSILPGVTRDSAIHMLKSWGVKVSERQIAIEELFEAAKEGRLREAFGTGTAAVISPIGELNWEGNIAPINGGAIGELSQKLYDNLTGIQLGLLPDTFGWTVEI